MMWPSVIGQERAKLHIRGLLDGNRLAHAYLFHGVEGTGKDAMALGLARAIHCEIRFPEPCETCASCIRIGKLQHEDVRFVIALPGGKGEDAGDLPMEKLTQEDVRIIREELRLKGEDPYHRISIPRASVIKMNTIREIRREAVLSTVSGRRRVVIISRAEDLNDESANMLLKTLEEPTGHTMFILTSSHPEMLLPTVRSRCHAVPFDPLEVSSIRTALVSRGLADQDRAALVAHLAMGSFTRSLELLQEDLVQERTAVLEFIRSSLGSSFIRLMTGIDSFSGQKDRPAAVRFLNLLHLWFRDALLTREEHNIVNIDQRDDLERFVRKFPDADLRCVQQEIESAISLIEGNGSISLVLIQLSIRLRRLVTGHRTLTGTASAR
jgi:DNA polymerase-3 subunit delta'